MKSYKGICLGIIALNLSFGSSSPEVRIKKVLVPTPLESLHVQGRFNLNIFGYIKILSATIYAENPIEENVLPISQTIALDFLYHRNISREELVKRGNDTLASQFPEETLERFANELSTINRSYQDVGKGDRYTLRSQPNRGLSLYRNEAHVLTIDNDAFSSFYLSIWLGENTPNQSIRQSLISTSSSS